MFQIAIARETLPAESQGSNIILLAHQSILTPEFLSSHKVWLIIF